MPSASSLETALDLWRRGLSIIPVPRPRPGVEPGSPGDGKVPSMPWKEFQQRRPTEEELRSWFGSEMNLAIVTGPVSGIVSVDADSPDAIEWITTHLHYTPWQTKTARGYHLFYAYPTGVHVGNKAKLHTEDGKLDLDVRGTGGYCIGPISLHASGVRYEFAGDWSVPRDQLPVFWLGWLRRPERPQPPRRPRDRPTGNVVERARRYLQAVPQPVIGQGSDGAVLYAACRLARGFGLDEHETVDLLWEWCGGRPGWTYGWVARKVRNAMQYGTEPVGALR